MDLFAGAAERLHSCSTPKYCSSNSSLNSKLNSRVAHHHTDCGVTQVVSQNHRIIQVSLSITQSVIFFHAVSVSVTFKAEIS